MVRYETQLTAIFPSSLTVLKKLPTGELFSVKFCFSVKFARRASLIEKQLAPFAHKAAQLDAVFDKFSGEFAGNCILVDAIAGRALNYARLRL